MLKKSLDVTQIPVLVPLCTFQAVFQSFLLKHGKENAQEVTLYW